MKKLLLGAWEVAEVVIVSVASIFIIYGFIAKPYVVEGKSMEPNFHDGNYLVIDEITYRFREPERGEVIVFVNPNNEKEFYIKRIVGLPGEEVKGSNGVITINGEKLDETYLPQDLRYNGKYSFKLREDQYFVMGDNRLQSYDSRSWGPLEKDKIVGEVRVRFWPLNEVAIY